MRALARDHRLRPGRGSIANVLIAGITTHPDTPWIMQVARNLADTDDRWLGNRLLQPLSSTALRRGHVQRRQRLGGVFSYYYREVA